MHDAASKSRIRKHAMKVSGLARRRSKQQQGDLIEVQLQIWPGDASALEQHNDTDEANDHLEDDLSTSVDNETQTSDKTVPMIGQRSVATPNKSSSVLRMQSSERIHIQPHWVFDYRERQFKVCR